MLTKLYVSLMSCCLLLMFSYDANGITLEVGPGKPFANPAQAAAVANPGDTILIFPSTYGGGYFIEDLHGNAGNWIYFIGVNVETVIFQGGSQGFHFSEVSFIKIANITFTGHTGNAMNIDDGGTFETPTHHIVVENCNFHDMGASGNNDFLKLSGIDDFEVLNCTFENGAAGGSGIDMVGCHEGWIHNNTFNSMGSNCIQAKGGTQFIDISQNWFENGGARTLNLGGSTDLQFFRPQTATFEAADLEVYANVFIGSTAPIAYVGCVRVNVINNTIITPGNWIIRILQETVDPERFEPCGDNSFINNIVYFTNSISTHVNIGPDTDPASFVFSNNLWYNASNPGNSSPNLPVSETNAVIGQNPQFEDYSGDDFQLTTDSPAKDAGTVSDHNSDYEGSLRPQGLAFDIGAFEFPGFLAVDWADFHLEPDGDGSVVLLWSIFSGQNSAGFEVWRSANGKDWESIASIFSISNASGIQEYQYTDKLPLLGLSYYRILHTDIYGDKHYSETIPYVHPSRQKMLNIYPNPGSSVIFIHAECDSNAPLYILDAQGKNLEEILLPESGPVPFGMDISFLKNGIYFLKHRDVTVKFIKH